MTREQKDLLIKDLCGRLPYDVKAYVKHWSKLDRKYYEDIYVVKSAFPSLNQVHVQSETGSVDVLLGYSDYVIKPYLFPLSSMTEEQYKKIWDCMSVDNKETLERANSGQKCTNPYSNVADYYNAHHFDYRGLIEKGLAIDATGLNIY